MMTRLKILALAGMCLTTLVCATSARDSIDSKRLKVFPENGWHDTGMKLTMGQFYRIEARGSWLSGYKRPAHGPEGWGSGTLNDGPLVGWISPHKPERLGYDSYRREVISKLIFIGEGGLFKAYGEGTLWLAMGEWSGCEECSGEIEVLINLYD